MLHNLCICPNFRNYPFSTVRQVVRYALFKSKMSFEISQMLSTLQKNGLKLQMTLVKLILINGIITIFKGRHEIINFKGVALKVQ